MSVSWEEELTVAAELRKKASEHSLQWKRCSSPAQGMLREIIPNLQQIAGLIQGCVFENLAYAFLQGTSLSEADYICNQSDGTAGIP